MKIDKMKAVQVDVKVVSIYCKVCDNFTYQLKDAEGEIVHDQDDGYVPDFMPGDHYGDYIILDIDMDTGMVLNWRKPTAQLAQELQRIVNKKDEE